MPGLRWTVFGTVVFFTLKWPVMRAVAVPPGAMLPRFALTGPVEPVGGPYTVPWLVVADWKTKLSGRMSRSPALSVVWGPALVTTME